ncbi:hypothetical protein NDU88_006754 [Pleurodeles waltl]|uniref:Uncharacterized protein n=1 Tax=Pleurodeles waltl TaxID=8319 RepID=A0AAV7UPZ1_PLEWA|nr:hypothetical protein NDU88_006754 [Pleurodeles waltl]
MHHISCLSLICLPLPDLRIFLPLLVHFAHLIYVFFCQPSLLCSVLFSPMRLEATVERYSLSTDDQDDMAAPVRRYRTVPVDGHEAGLGMPESPIGKLPVGNQCLNGDHAGQKMDCLCRIRFGGLKKTKSRKC